VYITHYGQIQWVPSVRFPQKSEFGSLVLYTRSSAGIKHLYIWWKGLW